MNARHLIPLSLLCAACAAPVTKADGPVPANAARLRVAKCAAPAPVAAVEYDQQITSRGPWKLFATAELDGALGAVDGDVLYARAGEEGVWAVLVSDYEGKVCEAFVREEHVVLVGVAADVAVDVAVDPVNGEPESVPDPSPAPDEP